MVYEGNTYKKVDDDDDLGYPDFRKPPYIMGKTYDANGTITVMTSTSGGIYSLQLWDQFVD